MIVVKIGGSVRRLDPLLEDIATTTEQTVVVHGAGRALDDLSNRLGSPPRMVVKAPETSKYQGRSSASSATKSTAMPMTCGKKTHTALLNTAAMPPQT